MKNSLKTLLTAIIIVSLSGCTFDLFEETGLYYPKVKIIDIQNNEFNETEVTFSVAEPKRSDISYMGIAKSTNSKPKTHERQNLFNGELGIFTVITETLSSDSTYNFIAFAANNSGYAESEVFTYNVPEPIPIEAPCSTSLNIVSEDNLNYTTSGRFAASRSSAGGEFYIEATYFVLGTRRQLEFHFPSIPKSGRYNTTTFDDFGNFNPDVLPDIFNFPGAFVDNQSIYVTVENNIITVEFCELEFESNLQDLKISGSISSSF